MDITEQKNRLWITFRHNPKNHKNIYPQSTALLLISVGQEAHESKKFDATIDLLNRSKFKKCIIMLGDAIQRYNLCFDQYNDMNEAHAVANELGVQWIERNKPFYSKLKIPYEILRWDHWLYHKDYQKHRTKVDDLYESDSRFRRAFFNSAEEFYVRYQKRETALKEDEDKEKFISLSLEYLKEECAIIFPLWVEQKLCDFIIYPSNMLEGMQATRDKLVVPFFLLESIFSWLPLRVKNKGIKKKN